MGFETNKVVALKQSDAAAGVGSIDDDDSHGSSIGEVEIRGERGLKGESKTVVGYRYRPRAILMPKRKVAIPNLLISNDIS